MKKINVGRQTDNNVFSDFISNCPSFAHSVKKLEFSLIIQFSVKTIYIFTKYSSQSNFTKFFQTEGENFHTV